MNVTYRLKSYELTDSFLKMVKDTFYGKEIEVSIEEIEDETAYISKFKGTRDEILAGLEAVKNENCVHSMTIEEMEEMTR